MFLKQTRLLKTVRKFLNLHEYQAAELLSHYQLPVLPGGHASTPTEAYEIAKNIKTPNLGYVLKAQIHSGGRGRGSFKQSGLQGGVQILDSPESVRDTARKMLNDILVTKQSGSEGKPCNTVYIVEKMNIEKEIYLAIMLDRENACPLLIASAQGGMGIEELDKKYILQKQINPQQGLTKQVIEQTVEFLELETEDQKNTMRNMLQGLYKCFQDKDCTLVEINPLGITKDKEIRIFDCKVKVDDNANIRQHELFKKEDLSQKDQKEVEASKYHLNYVKLDGNIGCLVNGAGLAMATMDLINYSNGKPANFLDIGGGSNAEAVKHAIQIINDDEDVKAILINIFGGIVRCDIVVEGIMNAVRDLKIKKPIVMRIKGNKSEEAKKMVKESGLNLYWFDDVKEAFALRVRPFSYKEKMQNMRPGWNVDGQVDQIKALNQAQCDQVFNFDRIFTEQNTNEHIYHEMCYEVIQKTLEGIDTTIFAYGQTGAGKTHTMLGPPNTFEFNGIIFRSLNDIFKRALNREEGEEYTLSCSYIEIYNEQVFDLLNKPEEMQHGLQIFEDMEKKKFMVKGKTIVKIESLEEVFKILKYGETNRKYAETYFNHKSSRSHSIFQVQIRVTKISDQGQSFLKESEVNFVDLAGNERLQYEYKIRGKSQQRRLRNKSTSIRGSKRDSLNDDSEIYHNPDFYGKMERQQRMNESKHINKSLFFLTQVIFMTSKGQNQKFIPFRNSPLTKILRGSLGGGSRTVLLLCMSPTLKDFDITLSTLRFGKCAKKIENKIRANVMSSYDKAAIQAIVDSYEKKLQMYNDKLKALEDNQVDFVKFWEQFGNFKNAMIKKLMGLEQQKLEHNRYYGLSKEDVTEDTINKKAGILFNVPLPDEEILRKRFEGKNCMNCQIQRTVEKFQIQNIPNIFSEFTNKLQQESQIEEFFKAVINKFKFNLQSFGESSEGLIQQNEHMKDLYEEFINHLINNYNKVSSELNMFTDQEQIKKLSDEEVDQFYKRLQYIYKIYQEEKIRRKVLKEVDLKYQVPEDESDIKNVFQEQYEELQEQIRKLDQDNLEIVRNFNKKYIDEFNNEVHQIENSLSSYIDKIYEMNYKIQNRFFDIYQKVERRFKFYEKKLEWISQNFSNKKKQVKTVRKKTAKEGLSQCMSEGNLSNISNPDFDQNNKQDMKEFLMYNMLNKRMDKIHQFHQNLQEIKQFNQKSLMTLPTDNLEQTTPKQNLANTDKDFYSYPQNTTTSEIMTKIPVPTQPPMPIKKPAQNEEENEPQKFMKKRESRQLFVQPTETQQEIYDQQLQKQKKQKFDLNNFLNSNHDLDFDIQKFKINSNHHQDNQNKQVFDDDLTPIPSDHKNSFQTQKDNTLLELQDQFENPLPLKPSNYQSEKKEVFSPMQYLSQSKKKNYTQLMKNYGKKSSRGKMKDLMKK